MLRSALLCIVMVLLSSNVASSQEMNRTFGAKDVLCTSSGGTEIKDIQTFVAPSGYFFSDVNIEEITPTISFAGGDLGCREWGSPSRTYAKTTALVGGNKVEISVPVSVTVFAHADCSSNYTMVLQQKRITASCKFNSRVAPLE
ncbi:hypothetical protein [Labrys sp. ZIDIC5]|uniref:hypothetical protein n=1 Tax=Labrys sedimenti TaxID=3106036 RepID=UPI002ACA7493|nr:hypothetical protein [Labrys sp. ZIDIC5]MDZ5454868.1 hypothetical protein [Labrys sp. ZIDIC5]